MNVLAEKQPGVVLAVGSGFDADFSVLVGHLTASVRCDVNGGGWTMANIVFAAE